MSDKPNAAKPMSLRAGLTFVIAVCGASRIFYLLSRAIFADILPVRSFYRHTSDDAFGTLNLWAHWGGDGYTAIASQGYEPGRAAFFPLYPLVVRCSGAWRWRCLCWGCGCFPRYVLFTTLPALLKNWRDGSPDHLERRLLARVPCRVRELALRRVVSGSYPENQLYLALQ